MTHYRLWIALAVVGLVAVAALFVLRGTRTASEEAIDLVELFPEAEKRTNIPNLRDAFKVMDVTIDERTKRSIFAHAFSRIIWTIVVPRGAMLETSAAVHPDVWDREGDGVIFRIGVSDGAVYDELYNYRVDPIGRPEDRRWFPVTIDLSSYEGQRLELIFNTDAGPTGDASYDWAVWGEPTIVSRDHFSD